MDRIITAVEAHQHFSEMLRDVAEGASFTVTSLGKPIARITAPIAEPTQSEKIAAYIERTKDRPIIHTGSWTREDLYG